MEMPFSRTLRSLEAESRRRSVLVLLLPAALLVAWLAWAWAASVPVLAASSTARLEATRSVHAVAAPIAGRLVATHLEVGREVTKDEVLVELDATAARLAFDEQLARVESARLQAASLRAEIAAEEGVTSASQEASRLVGEEAGARAREAAAEAKLGTEEAKRRERLAAEGLVSDAELKRASTNADVRRAAAAGANLAQKRITSQEKTKEGERLARLEQRRGILVQLEGDASAGEAAAARLEHDVAEHVVHSPVEGHLGRVASLGTGSWVEAGTILAEVVPPGSLRVVAEFQPSAALGRIREGQEARLRLDGFPWTQYGSVTCRVRAAGSEAHDGLVRVELEVEDAGKFTGPLEHGLPGTVEVLIERTSPLTLALRAAGRLIDGAAAGRNIDGAPAARTRP